MRRIALFGNNYQDGYISALERLMRLLERRGFFVYIHSEFARYLAEMGVTLPAGAQSASVLPDDAECVLSMGGDGTFLRAAEWVGARELPIAGINTGHLGFLPSYNLDEMESLVEVLATDTGMLERRELLKVESSAIPADFWPYALNEVSLLKAETASMVTVHAEINGSFLADYQADGLVVSTPTGSTAYNLSVGGPIIQPTLDCMVICPIAPHSLTMRPLVVAGDSEIRLTATSRVSHSRVSLDGRSFLIDNGTDQVRLTRGEFKVVVLRRPDADFSRLLRNKLHWGLR